jgi:hypothetical protein
VLVVLFIGILVGIESFSIIYKYMMSDEETDEDGNENAFSANLVLQNAEANLIGADLDGVIKGINAEEKKITLLNLKSSAEIELTATDDTKYPDEKSFTDYMIGDIVTYVYDDNKEITELKDCADAWEYSDKDATINTKASLVKFGAGAQTNAGKSFKYVDGLTTVRYKDKYMGFGDVSTIDYVTIRGYGGKGDSKNKPKKVYSITITKGHGQLVLQNFNSIVDGKLSIDDDVYNLADQTKYELTEGTYTIKITSSNCVDWTKEINISPTAACVLDLSKIEQKTGKITVSPSIKDCTIYVDDTQVKEGESVKVNYGEHKVTVTKTGYTTYSEKINVDKSEVTVVADMVLKPKLGSVYITVSPAKASVYVDGKKIGTGSTKTDVAVGKHTITAKADGFTTDGRTVTVNYEGETVECGIVLSPSKTIEKEVIPSTSSVAETPTQPATTYEPPVQQTETPPVPDDFSDNDISDADQNDIIHEIEVD